MTTGRINQVAFLWDAARPRTAGAAEGRARPSPVRSELLLGLGRESSSAACAGSESAARPRGPRGRRRLGGTRGAHRCPPTPFRGRRMEADRRAACFPRAGRQHKNRPPRNHPTSKQQGRIARRQFGGRAQSQPAATTRAPLTRPHVPAVPAPPRPPHPASPWAGEQVEAAGGAGPTPLGAKRTSAATFPTFPETPRLAHAPSCERFTPSPEPSTRRGYVRRLHSVIDCGCSASGARGESHA